MVLVQISTKCKLNMVEADSSGYSSDYAKHGFYVTAHTPKGLQPLLNLYIERNATLWQNQEVAKWLKKNVVIVAKKAELKDPMVDNCAAILNEEYSKSDQSDYLHHFLLTGK